MSEFRSPLRLELVCAWANDGRGKWEFTDDLRYYSDLLQMEVVVHKGFQYDQASVPRVFLVFTLYGGRYARSAGVHDLYCNNGAIPRDVADKVFLEAMRVENEEELAFYAAEGADEDEMNAHKARLEGKALAMYAGVLIGAKL